MEQDNMITTVMHLWERLRIGSPFAPSERVWIQKLFKEFCRQLRAEFSMKYGGASVVTLQEQVHGTLRSFNADGVGIDLELVYVNGVGTLRVRVPESREDWADKGWDMYYVHRDSYERVVRQIRLRTEGRQMEVIAMKEAQKNGEIW
jgi:hypothetical protein